MQLNQVTGEGVRIYNVSAGKSLPQWLGERRRQKKAAAADDTSSYSSQRLELLQDATFPIASQRIKASNDGRYLAATGTYAPQLKVFELDQLGLKFERHLDCEIVQFQILSDDFSKFAFLHSDRTIEFHARYGTYYKTRVPKVGRDMAYHYPSCDLVVAGSSREIYRLNLEQGRFLNPLTSTSPAINVMDISPTHGLLGFGGTDGLLQFFDPRTKKAVGHLAVEPACNLSNLLNINGNGTVNGDDDDVTQPLQPLASNQLTGVTALRFHPTNGLTFGVGTSGGHCLLYDLRSSRPLITREHHYGLPIIHMSFHCGHVLSADEKILKIWNPDTNTVLANVEPEGNINDVYAYTNSGLIFFAGEHKRIQIYYIPALGPAPTWCSFLDNLTDELEEDHQTVIYDDYKFVTAAELQQLGASKMIGSNYLRPYMHGFFMDMRLYNKLKAAADPFAYERYRAERIRALREEQVATRISSKRRKPQTANEQKQKLAENHPAKQDPRFAEMLTDPSFAFNKSAPDYLRIAAVTNIDETEFERVEPKESSSEGEDEEAQSDNDNKKPKPTTSSGPTFYQLKTTSNLNMRSSASNKGLQSMALGSRVKQQQATTNEQAGHHSTSRSRSGAMQVTFTPASTNKNKNKNKRQKTTDSGTIEPSPPSSHQRRSAKYLKGSFKHT
jgi:ribosome biogenesis protein ENP2